MASPQNPTPAPAPAPPPAPPTTTTTTTTTQPEQAQQQPAYPNPFFHNVALGVTPVAFLALFLPPRRLDARQLLLGGAALWGTNQLAYDYSGRSFVQRFGARAASVANAAAGTELPEKARRTQVLLRQERERLKEKKQQEAEALPGLGLPASGGELGKGMEEERQMRKEKSKERGMLEAIWMGDQDEDWKAKRDQREKEALSEGGGGYWGLISDQISEVWNSTWKKEKEAQAAEVKASNNKAGEIEGKKP